MTTGLPGFVPTSLTVACASGRNFRVFRKYSDYLGLTGVVSMTFARGKYGAFDAGNLLLFPWLKPKGSALGPTRDWQTVSPTSSTQFMAASPIPNWTSPLDEYFCRYVIQAPATMFIGFRVDTPFSPDNARRDWYTNIDKLADGKGVGIGWTSSNLNAPWFGGSQWIPPSDQCYGNAWRKLIADALSKASTAVC